LHIHISVISVYVYNTESIQALVITKPVNEVHFVMYCIITEHTDLREIGRLLKEDLTAGCVFPQLIVFRLGWSSYTR